MWQNCETKLIHLTNAMMLCLFYLVRHLEWGLFTISDSFDFFYKQGSPSRSGWHQSYPPPKKGGSGSSLPVCPWGISLCSCHLMGSTFPASTKFGRFCVGMGFTILPLHNLVESQEICLICSQILSVCFHWPYLFSPFSLAYWMWLAHCINFPFMLPRDIVRWHRVSCPNALTHRPIQNHSKIDFF